MEFLQKILEKDTELFLFLNNYHSDYWDTVMVMVTRKEMWLPFFIAIFYFIIKKYRSKSLLVLFFLALVILFSDQLSVLLKDAIQRLRPVYDPYIKHLVHNVFRKGGLYGFVSSHAANTFGVFVFTSRLFRNRGYSFLLLFWAILVSYSRIYLGVHYPLDIIGGAILGWLIGIIVFRMMIFLETHFFLARNPKIKKTNLNVRQTGLVFLVFLLVISNVLIMAAVIHYHNILFMGLNFRL